MLAWWLRHPPRRTDPVDLSDLDRTLVYPSDENSAQLVKVVILKSETDQLTQEIATRSVIPESVSLMILVPHVTASDVAKAYT